MTRASYYMGLEKKVKWDSIGITEKLLGLQSGSKKKQAQSCLGFYRDSRGILKKAFWDYIGIIEINSWVSCLGILLRLNIVGIIAGFYI